MVVWFSVEDLINSHQLERIFVGEPSDHAALQVMVINQLLSHCYVLQASVQLEGQLRKLLFQQVHTLVNKRRNATILSRVEAFEDCLSSVDDEVLDRSCSAS